MDDLDQYFKSLMIREVEQFRDGKSKPSEDPTMANTADDPAATTDGEATKQQPAPAAKQPQPEPQPEDISALLDAEEAAKGFQGTPLALIPIATYNERARRNNLAREQRVLRLAQKLGVRPGAARWVRNGQPYAQPAVPRSVVRSKDNIVEHNQFMYDGEGDDKKVVLRMPGGWKRDLVRNRPAFKGVAIIGGGFLWPRFEKNLNRRITVDWEEQGFVEFNEVRYTTAFVAREPRPAPRGSSDEDGGVLIDFEE